MSKPLDPRSEWTRRQILGGMVVLAGVAVSTTALGGLTPALRTVKPRRARESSAPALSESIPDEADFLTYREGFSRSEREPIRIVGTLVDAENRPLPAARIEAWQAPENLSGDLWAPSGVLLHRCTVSDRHGGFAFRAFRPGALPARNAAGQMFPFIGMQFRVSSRNHPYGMYVCSLSGSDPFASQGLSSIVRFRSEIVPARQMVELRPVRTGSTAGVAQLELLMRLEG
ncbi:MAG: hypothetical protein IT285_07770 [Bdellovibrionales bacterium]|nr:hypothetical protein [Bdellovibrionales bacterium]